MEENMNDKYREVIFPSIYGMDYDKAMAKGIIGEPEEEIPDEEPIEDTEELPDEIDTEEEEVEDGE